MVINNKQNTEITENIKMTTAMSNVNEVYLESGLYEEMEDREWKEGR